MLIEPGVEVNNVVNQAPPQTHGRRADLGEEGGPNAEIGRCLPFGQTPSGGQLQATLIGLIVRLRRRHNRISPGAAWIPPAEGSSAVLERQDQSQIAAFCLPPFGL